MELKGEQISLVELAAVALGGEAVHVSSIARPRILAARKLIEEIVARDVVIYGVNTGFGKLSDVRIPHAELHQLQLNLIRSHACGIGNPLSEGEVFFEAQRMPSAEALRRVQLAPLQLEAKEGLALLNGTQAMHAVGGLALLRAQRLACVADVAGAMSLEALKGTPAAFDLRLQQARPHPGQKAVAKHLLSLMEDSEIRQSHVKGDPRVQDAYSLRCMPQVHGAVRGALTHCEDVLLIESASATDNPLVFADSGEVISGGNFHGAPLAFAFDYAAIGIVDLMNMSERRIDRLVNPDKNEGLSAFLARKPGVESGFMIAQVAAASLVSEARVLAHPASADNITTSGGKEDHVSMGMTSALKLRSIVDLAENLLAIELLTAAEGLQHRRPLKAGAGVEQAFAVVREIAPPLTHDRALSGDIARVAEAIRRGDFDGEDEKS